VEKVTKVSKRTIRRILGEYKKQEAQASSFGMPGKTNQVQKHKTHK
jgi:hypothetical protein